MIKNIVLVYIIFAFFPVFVFAQEPETDKSNLDAGFITGFSYGYFVSGGDLNERFGNNFKIDISPVYYFKNSNFSLGINAGYIFGNEVKINPLTNLLSYDGQIISIDNSFSLIRMYERGFLGGINIGKIIPFGEHKRTGLKLELGANIFRHWIFFQKEFGIIPQLENEYLKGYDRLTGGIAIKEFIGYQYLKRKSKINFYAGFELIQGFTRSLRKYNYDQAAYDLDKRKDFLTGFKFGWILPLYIVSHPEEIYY